tara:strand:- start:249 stop:593 length:345 start_codon:yes stop_codon:yes gene_type:complete
MRKIEREMIQAIINRKSFKKANTSVSIEDTYMSIKLHGNEIAKYYYNKDNSPLYINHCGWKTNTTKSRLNALIKFVLNDLSFIFQKQGQWFMKQTDPATGMYDEYEIPNAWLLV